MLLSGLFYATLVLALVRRISDASFLDVPFYDDTFYYVVTAKNFVRHGFFTFDGANATNGFHPLWMLMLTAIFALVGATQSVAVDLMSVICLQSAVHFLAGACCWRFATQARRAGDAAASAGFALMAFGLILPNTSGLFATGMETVVSACLLVLSIHFFLSRNYPWLGLCWALLFLSRLDQLVFVVFPLFVYLFFAERPSIKNLSYLMGPTAICLGVLSLVNWLVFGHVKPISGALKSSFPIVLFKPSILLDPFAEASALGLWSRLAVPHGSLVMVASFAALVVHVCVKSKRAYLALCVAGLWSSLNWILFQKWNRGIEVWYIGAPFLLTMFAFGSGVGQLLASRPLGAKVLTALGCALLIGTSVLNLYKLKSPKRNSFVDSDLTVWMKQQPPGTRFAATDAGAMAFYSGQPVVNLDGLVNDYRYQDAIVRKGGFRKYLADQKVRYLIVGFAPQPSHWLREEPMWTATRNESVFKNDYESVPFYVYSYLYDQFGDSIELRATDEVYREPHGVVLFDLEKAFQRAP